MSLANFRALKIELASLAEQMGALHRYDLTQEVTHLIVGSYDTPKYRYVAKERPDVRPMTVAWIEKVRELWINDQEIDTDMLEREFALPTFNSLKFSMTGCEDRKIYGQNDTIRLANRLLQLLKGKRLPNRSERMEGYTKVI